MGLSLSRLGRYFCSQMARSSTVQKKCQVPQRVGACGYLPVLVRLVHHGSLRGAIVGVLGRKHGASASPRLAGISRRPNVWWPKVEQKNNFFGFVLQTSMNPPVHSVIPHIGVEGYGVWHDTLCHAAAWEWNWGHSLKKKKQQQKKPKQAMGQGKGEGRVGFSVHSA